MSSYELLNVPSVILIIDIALLAWAMNLMQSAYQEKEFALLFAGTLVSLSAVAIVAVYILSQSYIVYLYSMPHQFN
jgi:hypothetical protein